jgi:hypothetical protein
MVGAMRSGALRNERERRTDMLVEMHETEDCLQVAWDSLTLIVFVGTARAEDVRTIWRNDRDIISRHGSLTSITVMTGELRMTAPDEVKQLAAEMTADLAQDSVGGAVVVPWEGLAGATFRTVLASIYLLGRIRTPNKVFKALPAAIDWVLELPNQLPALAAARAVVHERLTERVAVFESLHVAPPARRRDDDTPD